MERQFNTIKSNYKKISLHQLSKELSVLEITVFLQYLYEYSFINTSSLYGFFIIFFFLLCILKEAAKAVRTRG